MKIKTQSHWLLFVLAVPGQQANLRMRVWRTLKGLGAAVLRDGVYLLPWRADLVDVLDKLAQDIRSAGESWTFCLEKQTDEQEAALPGLFDRREEYQAFLAQLAAFHTALATLNESEARRTLRRLHKDLAAVRQIDYFPDAAHSTADSALHQAQAALEKHFSPGEPDAASGAITVCQLADYQGKTWATRARPWVDRLASAWLIARFIDPQARFLWLQDPADCPAEALGFDFDGAVFSHAGEKVTFEVLLASFNLADSGLKRLAALVHFLDIGGAPIAEAAGVEMLLAGMRQQYAEDDALCSAAANVFDALYSAILRRV